MITSFYLVHDCETGGLEPTKNPITEYAGIILDYKTLKEVDRFQTYVQPYNDLKIEPEALAKTGIRMSDVKNGMPLKDFSNTLKGWYGEHQGKSRYKDANRLISVGHNIVFDHRFLEYTLAIEKVNFFEFVHDTFIDTMLLSKLIWGLDGNEKLRLSDSCARAKISLTDAHGAMNDVEATADLFRWMTRRSRRSGSGEETKAAKADRERGQRFFEFQCASGNK